MHQQFTNFTHSAFLNPQSHPHPYTLPPQSRQKQCIGSSCGKGKNKVEHNWAKSQKQAYARLLLSYLMAHIQPNQFFIQHLADILAKSHSQVYSFHRKMLTEFKNSKTIVTHLLRKKMPSLCQGIRQNGPQMRQNAQLNNIFLLNKQVQEQVQNQREGFLTAQMIEISLDSYQQRQDEYIEIFQLEDEQYQQQSTNGSFEWDEEQN